MRPRRLHRVFFVAALGLLSTAATLVSTEAMAKTGPAIGMDLDLAVPTTSQVGFGTGIGFRLGAEIHLPALAITPEVDFAYYNFSGTFGPQIYRGMAGLRLGLGEIIRPGAFAHIGLGDYVPSLAAATNQPTWEFDAGGFLDFTLIPILNFGAHAAYNHSSGTDPNGHDVGWFTFGAHAALVF